MCYAVILAVSVCGLTPPPLVPRRLYLNWVALNSRSTTSHIMRPLSLVGRDECVQIKLQLSVAKNSGIFVVDAFADSAVANSVDEESRSNGGLIGTRLRQGVCRVPELDRACFCSPLGIVTGPLQTPEGYHLVLVEERIGLEVHDSGMTRVVAEALPSGGVRSVLAPPDPDDVSELVAPDALLNVLLFALASWFGGQLLSTWASSIDVEQIANSIQ